MESDIKSRVYKRLIAEGRWLEAVPIKDQLLRDNKAQGMTREQAAIKAYQTLDAMFPAGKTMEPSIESANDKNTDTTSAIQPQKVEGDNQPPTNGMQKVVGDDANRGSQHDEASESTGARTRSSESTVSGLGKIPASWPQLPSNATLSQEVQWVLANRIQVIKETNDGIVVDLSKALSPAPSYATLGWLETSIRAFAKFVDVSTKASANSQDDADKVKREKLEIAEIRELLGQMRDLVASK